MKNTIFMLGLLGLLAMLSLPALAMEEMSCDQCDLSKCPPVGDCPAGRVRDNCGCCEICGLEQGQLCDYSATKANASYWHGFCGNNMECRKRTDINSKDTLGQSVCECLTEGYICGSDDETYSPCQFAAAQARSKITLKHDSPCQTRPKIVSYSSSKRINEGKLTTVLCEVQGYPIPTMVWYFTPSGDMSAAPVQLPGDSEDVSISVRGGPEKMRVTSYLQIANFKQQHEGIYECVANAIDGIASQRINLVNSHEPEESRDL